MVQGRKTTGKNMTSLGEFFWENVACYSAWKQILLLPCVWGNTTAAWRNVFVLLRVRVTLVTSFYLDHLFPDLITATFWRPWGVRTSKYEFWGDMVQPVRAVIELFAGVSPGDHQCFFWFSNPKSVSQSYDNQWFN